MIKLNPKWVLLFALLFPVPALAWGPVGHETIAYIASDNLTPAAKEKLNTLFPDYSTDFLANVSNWADDIRENGRPETAPWHYIDLPIRKDITVKDEEDYCPHG